MLEKKGYPNKTFGGVLDDAVLEAVKRDPSCVRDDWSNATLDAFKDDDVTYLKHVLLHTAKLLQMETVKQELDHSDMHKDLVKTG